MKLQFSDKELDRLIESATYSAQSQFEQAKTWRLVDWSVSALAAAFAGVAGIAQLATDVPAPVLAVLALVASSLVIVHATLRPEGRYVRGRDAGNAYLSLASSARVLRDTCDGLAADECDATFRGLLAEQRRVNVEAELPFAPSFYRGRRNVRAGYQTYKVDVGDAA